MHGHDGRHNLIGCKEQMLTHAYQPLGMLVRASTCCSVCGMQCVRRSHRSACKPARSGPAWQTIELHSLPPPHALATMVAVRCACAMPAATGQVGLAWLNPPSSPFASACTVHTCTLARRAWSDARRRCWPTHACMPNADGPCTRSRAAAYTACMRPPLAGDSVQPANMRSRAWQ